MKTRFDASVIEAAHVYLSRRDGVTHPSGGRVPFGRWYPDSQEEQKCCMEFRWFTKAARPDLRLHCRTAVHVAQRFNVNRAVLLACARALERQEARDV